jgi:hypothetical protein
VGAFRLKSLSSSFFIHLRSLLTALIAFGFVIKGSKAAYNSNPPVTFKLSKTLMICTIKTGLLVYPSKHSFRFQLIVQQLKWSCRTVQPVVQSLVSAHKSFSIFRSMVGNFKCWARELGCRYCFIQEVA